MERQLIINLSAKNNYGKEEQVLKVLEEMAIEYKTTERQTIEEYNQELDEAEAAIERGEFITAEDLLKESRLWK